TGSHQKMVPFRKGADGVARSASPTGRSLKKSSAGTFRPEDLAELTTPSAALRWLRNFLLMPQPPLLCKEGNEPGRRSYKCSSRRSTFLVERSCAVPA